MKIKLAVLAAGVLACATSASAFTTFDKFSGFDPSGHSFTLDFSIDSVTAPDSSGVPITSFFGQLIDGNIISSVVGPTNLVGVDNLVFTGGGPDTNGFGFLVGGLNSVLVKNVFDGTYVFGSDAPQFGGIGNSVPVSLSAVPEPATWALMLVGFGAIGYSMRRSRHMSVNTAGSRATI
jgi:hypothetical protein